MPPVVAEIVSLLIQFEPQIQEGVLELVKLIKANHEGQVAADEADAQAREAIGLLMSRLGNTSAEETGDDSAVDADAASKFDKGEP